MRAHLSLIFIAILTSLLYSPYRSYLEQVGMSPLFNEVMRIVGLFTAIYGTVTDIGLAITAVVVGVLYWRRKPIVEFRVMSETNDD